MKLSNRISLIVSIAFAMSATSCFDEPYLITPKETFTREFIKKYGLIDPDQDWNRAMSGEVTVVPDGKAASVQVYAQVGDSYYLVANLTDISSPVHVPLDVPRSTNKIKVVADGRSYYGDLGSEIKCISTTVSSRTIPDTESPKGGYTVTVSKSESDYLDFNARELDPILNPNVWAEYYSVNAGKMRYNNPGNWDMPRDASSQPETQGFLREDGNNTYNEEIVQNFTLDTGENGAFTIYPMFWNTQDRHVLGIYLINEDGSPVTDENGVIQRFPVYSDKAGDELQIYNRYTQTRFQVSPTTTQLKKGSSIKLTAYYEGSVISGATYSITSGEGLVSLSADGTVTALASSGSAVVTVSYQGNTATCNITLVSKYIGTFSASDISVPVDDNIKVPVIATYDYTGYDMTYAIDNEYVATVDEDGYVTGVSEGNATLTVTIPDLNESTTVNVTVTKKLDGTFGFAVASPHKMYVNTPETFIINATGDFENKGVTISANPEGMVYQNQYKNALSATNNYNGTYSVTVYPVATGNVTISALCEGKTATLELTVKPERKTYAIVENGSNKFADLLPAEFFASCTDCYPFIENYNVVTDKFANFKNKLTNYLTTTNPAIWYPSLKDITYCLDKNYYSNSSKEVITDPENYKFSRLDIWDYRFGGNISDVDLAWSWGEKVAIILEPKDDDEAAAAPRRSPRKAQSRADDNGMPEALVENGDYWVNAADQVAFSTTDDGLCRTRGITVTIKDANGNPYDGKVGMYIEAFNQPYGEAPNNNVAGHSIIYSQKSLNSFSNCDGGAPVSFAASYKHPVSGRAFFSFEDWIQGSDDMNDLNDLIFSVKGFEVIEGEGGTPIVDEETPDPDPTTTTSTLSWLVAAEDLGGSDDFDFNDVVFNLSSITEVVGESDPEKKVIVQALAAGGSLETYLHYHDGNTDWLLGPDNLMIDNTANTDGNNPPIGYDKCEWHRWFDTNDVSKMINTGQSVVAKPGQCDLTDVRSTVNLDNFTVENYSGLREQSVIKTSIRGFYITVNTTANINASNMQTLEKEKSTVIASPEEPGQAPQMFLIPDIGCDGDPWYWPHERFGINEVYEKFSNWVSSGTSNGDWHTEKPKGTKGQDVVRPVTGLPTQTVTK